MDSAEKSSSKSPGADQSTDAHHGNPHSSSHGNRERKSSTSSTASSAAATSNNNIFDPVNLLGSLSSLSSQNAAALAQMYSPAALSMMAAGSAGMPGSYFPGFLPYGGLGAMSQAFPSPLSPTTGGADWWRAMSEHSRRLVETSSGGGGGGATMLGLPAAAAALFPGALDTPSYAAASYGMAPWLSSYGGLTSAPGLFSSSPSKTTSATSTCTRLSPSSSTGSGHRGERIQSNLISPKSDKDNIQPLDAMSALELYNATKSALERNKDLIPPSPRSLSHDRRSPTQQRERHPSHSSDKSDHHPHHHRDGSGGRNHRDTPSKSSRDSTPSKSRDHHHHSSSGHNSGTSYKDKLKESSSILKEKDKLSSLSSSKLDPAALLMNNPGAIQGLFPMDPLTNTASPFYFPFGVGAGLPGATGLPDPSALVGLSPFSAPSLFGYSSTTSPTTVATTSTYSSPFTTATSTSSHHSNSSHHNKDSKSKDHHHHHHRHSSEHSSLRHSNNTEVGTPTPKEFSEFFGNKSVSKDVTHSKSPSSSMQAPLGSSNNFTPGTGKSEEYNPYKRRMSSSPMSKMNGTASKAVRVTSPSAIPKTAHSTKAYDTPARVSNRGNIVSAHSHKPLSLVKAPTPPIHVKQSEDSLEGVLDLSVKKLAKPLGSSSDKPSKTSTPPPALKSSSIYKGSSVSTSIRTSSPPLPAISSSVRHSHKSNTDITDGRTPPPAHSSSKHSSLSLLPGMAGDRHKSSSLALSSKIGDRGKSEDSKLHSSNHSSIDGSMDPSNAEEEEYRKNLSDQHVELASQQAELLASAFQQNLSDYYAYMSLMPPMFDASTGMIIPPPPPPSSAALGSGSNGSRGSRGRGGRSRGGAGPGRPRTSSTSLTTAEAALAAMTPTAASRAGRPRGNNRGRGRTKNVESRSLAELAMEFHRQQMEDQFKHRQQQSTNENKDPSRDSKSNDKRSSSPKEDEKEGEMLSNGGASVSAESYLEKLKAAHTSKLEQVLMGPQEAKAGREALIEHMAAKMKEACSTTESEGFSSSESELETGSTGSGDTGSVSSPDSDYDSTTKRGSDDQDTEDAPQKKRRRRTIFDETEIRIPIEHGWRRETRIREVNRKGIFGDVFYYTPCDKKLKTYLEVEKYLIRNNITDLNKENFTFSCSVNVGEFYEYNESLKDYVLLEETDVIERFIVIEERKKRIYERKQREIRRMERKKQSFEMARKLEEVKKMKHVDHQDLARKVAEIKMKRKVEKQQQKEQIRRAKYQRAMELKKFRERQKAAKIQKEQMEREMKTQQLVEDKKMKRERQQYAKYAEMIQKAQERELKRQKEFFQKEQERERRRQHLLMARAMEARKKMEEKERLKELKREEKRLDRERKMEQKRVEVEMALQLKKPIDDMSLCDHKDMPTLDRIPGVRIDGDAYANCLMVIEFTLNFKDALKFDKDQLPTMIMLQKGLLNDKEHMDDFMQFTTNLLALALDEPGVPNIKEAVTSSGDKITTIDITDYSISEVLRVFIKCRNGHEDEMTDWLKEFPYQALNPRQKSAILAFLCNELLCGKYIVSDIEKTLEKMNNLRRDKWEVDNELRRLKLIRSRKFILRPAPPDSTENSQMTDIGDGTGIAAALGNDDSGTADNLLGKKIKQEVDEHEDSDEGEHDMIDDKNVLEGADAQLSAEELDKKIEKLSKQQNSFRAKVFDVSHKLRGMEFGQDRYKRSYWALPQCGGMYVEGMESGEKDVMAQIESKRVAIKTEQENKLATSFANRSQNNTSSVALNKMADENGKLVLSENKMDMNGIKEEVKDGVKRELSFSGDLTKFTLANNSNTMIVNNDREDEAKFGVNSSSETAMKAWGTDDQASADIKKEEKESPKMKLEDYPLFRMDFGNTSSRKTENSPLNAKLEQTHEEEKDAKNSTNVSTKMMNGHLTEDEIKKTLRESLQGGFNRKQDSINPAGIADVNNPVAMANVNNPVAMANVNNPVAMANVKQNTDIVSKMEITDNAISSKSNDLIARKEEVKKSLDETLSKGLEGGANEGLNRLAEMMALKSDMLLSASPVLRNDKSGICVNVSADKQQEGVDLKTAMNNLYPSKLFPGKESITGSSYKSIDSILTSSSSNIPDKSQTEQDKPNANKNTDPSAITTSCNNKQEVPLNLAEGKCIVSTDTIAKMNTTSVISHTSQCSTGVNKNTTTLSSTLPMATSTPCSSSSSLMSLATLGYPPNTIINSSPLASIVSSQSVINAGYPGHTAGYNTVVSSLEATAAIDQATAIGTWFSVLPRIPCNQSSTLYTTSLHKASPPPKAASPHHYYYPQFSNYSSYANSRSNTPGIPTPCGTPVPGAGDNNGVNSASGSSAFPYYTPEKSYLANGVELSAELLQQGVVVMCGDVQYPEPKPIPKALERGWWQISNPDITKEVFNCLHGRGVRERNLQKTLKMYYDYATQMCSKTQSETVRLEVSEESKAACANDTESPLSIIAGTYSDDILMEIERGLLEEIQDMEDRVCGASLQIKVREGYKIPTKATEDESIELVLRRPTDSVELKPKQKVIMEVAKSRLLDIERNIERRYLKPPLCKQSTLTLNALTSAPKEPRLATTPGTNSDILKQTQALTPEGEAYDVDNDISDSLTPTDAPKELLMWRTAVTMATSVSQLACCLLRLQHGIAWEKSVMKVTCQICCKDDNEAELLLCDSCDKGYHTYCFKPALSDIPDGDWYCYECISRATGESHCVSCGRRLGKMVTCEHCHRVQHLECAQPPLSRMPRKWSCSACIHTGRGKAKKSRRPKLCDRSEDENSVSEESVATAAAITAAAATAANINRNLDQVLDSISSPAPSLIEAVSVISETSQSKKKDKQQTPVEKKKKKKKKKKPTDTTATPCVEEESENTESNQNDIELNTHETNLSTVSETEAVVTPFKSAEKPKKKKKKKKKAVTMEEGGATSSTVITTPVKPIPLSVLNKHHQSQSKAVPDLDKSSTDVYDFDDEADKEVVPLHTPSKVDISANQQIDGDASTEGELEVDVEETDMGPCSVILCEMREHDEGWPFLKAVDTRQFPQYKKIIKKPMDFNTMCKKLRDNVYTTRREFCSDARQVFDNCEIFNEDESPVGQAGHMMRKFFEKRWRELCL